VKASPAAIAELSLIALTSAAGALLSFLVPVLGLPLAAAPLAWLAWRFGYGPAIAAAVLVTGLATLAWGDISAAMIVGPALLAVGPATAWALERWTVLQVAGGLAVVLVTVAFVPAIIGAAQAGTTLSGVMNDMVRSMVAESAKAANVQQPGNAQKIKDAAAVVTQVFTLSWPGALVVWFAIPAVFSVPAVSRVGRALGRRVSIAPALPDLDVTPHIVWPTIAGIGLLAAATYLRQPTGWMMAVGWNLLLVVRPVLFLQGLGDFAALYRKAGVSRFARRLGYVLLAATEAIVPFSISLVGLVDLFANLRKLPRKGMDASGGAAPA
jgi:hypothetical protein